MSYYERRDFHYCDFKGRREHVVQIADEDGLRSYSSRDAQWGNPECLIVGMLAWGATNWMVALAVCVVHYGLSISPVTWKFLAVASGLFWGGAVGYLVWWNAETWTGQLGAVVAFAFVAAAAFGCHARGHLYHAHA